MLSRGWSRNAPRKPFTLPPRKRLQSARGTASWLIPVGLGGWETVHDTSVAATAAPKLVPGPLQGVFLLSPGDRAALMGALVQVEGGQVSVVMV